MLGVHRFAEVTSASPCPLCGSTAAWQIGTRGRDGEALRSVLCRACGHSFTDPQPDAQTLAAFYAARYRADYKQIIEPKPYHVLRAARVAAQRVRRLVASVTPGPHLDIGAGGGEFSVLARKAGFEITAIEPNAGYAQYAKHTYGLNVLNGTLESAEFAAGRFGSASLFHVLEHLLEPAPALRRIGQWLKADGWLYLEVPNLLDIAQSPRSRFHRAHIHHFTPVTLARALAQAGFAVRETWLSADGGVISALAQRSDDVAVPAVDPAHARANMQTLARHTPLRHALRFGWLPRALRKQSRRIEEGVSARGKRGEELVLAGGRSQPRVWPA